MHETFEKYGIDRNVVKKYGHWTLLIKDVQVTLGDLVLIVNRDVRRFSELNNGEQEELHIIISEVENTLTSLFDYDKINWTMFMMRDPQVHFHIYPRYKNEREFAGKKWIDDLWPRGFTPGVAFDRETGRSVVEEIRQAIEDRLP